MPETNQSVPHRERAGLFILDSSGMLKMTQDGLEEGCLLTPGKVLEPLALLVVH